MLQNKDSYENDNSIKDSESLKQIRINLKNEFTDIALTQIIKAVSEVNRENYQMEGKDILIKKLEATIKKKIK